MSFIKRSQDSTTNNFHNLQHLNDSEENDVQEEEYQWIKKRNAKLLKDQQQQNKSKVQEEDDKKNSIDKENIFSAGSKEENDPQEVLTTPQKENKEEKKSTRILTPIQSNSNRILVQRNNGKSAFKSPSKNSESSFPSDDFVKLLSPVIETVPSLLFRF